MCVVIVTSQDKCLLRRERDVLVRRRVGVARNEPEPGFSDARADPVEERELPNGRVDHALLDELLDPLQGCLAPLGVGFRGLLAEEAAETDAKRREATLQRIQQLVQERVVYAPIWQLAFLNGVGPHVGESGLGLIPGHAYSAPYEDVTLKAK